MVCRDVTLTEQMEELLRDLPATGMTPKRPVAELSADMTKMMSRDGEMVIVVTGGEYSVIEQHALATMFHESGGGKIVLDLESSGGEIPGRDTMIFGEYAYDLLQKALHEAGIKIEMRRRPVFPIRDRQFTKKLKEERLSARPEWQKHDRTKRW